jgi:SAM-dependent methyltransferase
MNHSRSLAYAFAASAVAILLALSLALAEPKSTFEPQVGQEGKDVIWVPTAQALVERMLDMARVGPGDIVYDLGSGDGRTVIAAAKRGATAFGVEFNPDMVSLSRENAKKAGVADRTTFIQGDLFAADISKATVITLFLLPSLNVKLRPKLLDLRPGTRVVSNSFDMGDWRPDRTDEAVDDCSTYCRAHLWIVPAKVEGTWQLPNGELRLNQTYQWFDGELRQGSTTMAISDGKLAGDQISFVAGDTRYTGRVSGNAMEGLALSSTGWRVTRN